MRSLWVRFDRTELIKISKYWQSLDSANPCLIRFDSVSEKNSRVSLYAEIEEETVFFKLIPIINDKNFLHFILKSIVKRFDHVILTKGFSLHLYLWIISSGSVRSPLLQLKAPSVCGLIFFTAGGPNKR